MQKIRKGDEVIVITGRDKGKRGTVLRRVDDAHLVVEGINVVKKHVRPNPMKGETGGIVDKIDADRPVERDAVQPGHRQGRSCRHQGARGRHARSASSSRNGELVNA